MPLELDQTGQLKVKGFGPQKYCIVSNTLARGPVPSGELTGKLSGTNGKFHLLRTGQNNPFCYCIVVCRITLLVHMRVRDCPSGRSDRTQSSIATMASWGGVSHLPQFKMTALRSLSSQNKRGNGRRRAPKGGDVGLVDEHFSKCFAFHQSAHGHLFDDSALQNSVSA